MPDCLNWNDLKIALAIERTGSLARASEAAGIDPSTAGRRLSALEAALGVVLFVRGRAGLTPTDAGRAVMVRAREMANGAARLQEEVHSASKNPSGMVRLFGNPWMLEILAEKAVPLLADRYPDIKLKMVGGTQPPDYPVGEAALSLWFERTPRESEFSLVLGEIPYAVYTQSNQAADQNTWVVFCDDEAPMRQPARWHEARVDPEEKIALVAADAGILRGAVRAGVGKSLIPMCLCEDDPKTARVSQGPPEMKRVLHLHVQPDTMQAVNVRVVIAWLRETFATTFVP